jgi:hypothetical protein
MKRSSPLCAGLLLLLLAPRLHADLPMPRFDRLLPLGGLAGSTVEVEVAANDAEEATTLFFDHPGLTAVPVEGKEKRFAVTIAADVPSGTYDAWLVGRYGVSNPRLFAVFRGLVPVAEQEPNNTPEKPQALSLNTVVQGVSDGNDQDVFRFTARAGQRITIRCDAQRLESSMDPTLGLSHASGAALQINSDYFGRDPLIDFIAPADGDYLATVNDLSYRGGMPYLLFVSDQPQTENAFPRALQTGRATELMFFGRNYGAGTHPGAWRVGDLAFDEISAAVTPPADLTTTGGFPFGEHPTDHVAVTTASTCTLTGFQACSPLAADHGRAVPLLVTDHPATTEQEPNDTQEQPQPLAVPGVVSGRFDAARDRDWYEFETTEAGAYWFDVYCERIAGRADPYLAIFDAKGTKVVEMDDYGHRIKGFDGHLRDPSGQVNLAAGKKYRLLVQDRYQRGGGRYQYVLSVRRPEPDFHAASMHRQNPGPAGTTVGRGGATYLDVVIHSTGGFTGPVTVTADNPPPGLRVQPTTITGVAGVVVIEADADAADALHSLSLVAMGTVGDRTITHAVRPYTRTGGDPSPCRPMRRLPVAVRDVAPFDVRVEPAAITVESGRNADVRLKLDRRWPDAKNAVTIESLSFPNGFTLGNTELKPDATELPISIAVNANTKPGEYTLVMLCQSQVPFTKDAQGANKANQLVALPSRPLKITVTAPPKP